MTRLEIRQNRSSIGEKEGARRTLSALGLRRTGQIVSHEDSPVVRGMLRRVAHLVIVRGAGAPRSAPRSAPRPGASAPWAPTPGAPAPENPPKERVDA